MSAGGDRRRKAGRGLRLLPLLAVLVASVGLALWGCGSRSVRPTRELVIGTDATFPPLEFMQGEAFRGFDIEMGTALAREMGRKPVWVNCGFDGIFAALQGGKFDLVISSITITEDRRKSLAFSTPYYTAGQALVCRKDGPAYGRPDDLAGKTCGIQINTSTKEVLRNFPLVKVREFNTVDLALLDLQNGNIDAVMGDSPVLRYMLANSFKSLHEVGSLVTREQYGITLRPADAALLKDVNRGLARLEAKGELDRLRHKWFNERPAARTRGGWWSIALQVAPILASAALVTIALTVAALLTGVPLGLLFALMRISRNRLVSAIAVVYIEVMRGTPLLVQVFTVYYVLPAVGVQLNQWSAALLAFGANSSAYCAEIFRAGIVSLDRGQSEAARSLGMTYGQSMRLVLLPQALRRVMPPLTNEAIALLKDTSLVSVIAMVELTRQGQQLTGSLAVPFVIWPMVGLFYLILTLPLTRAAAYMEQRWSTERH